MNKTASIKNHTFSEAVIVNGRTFQLKQWYDVSMDGGYTICPFVHQNGRQYETRMDDFPATLAKVRKAVIEQIKHLDKLGFEWDRRKRTKIEGGS